jgi:predicted dehydrogenase
VKPPFRIAIVGMGGFAGLHHSTIARLEERGLARLVATCDPRAAAFAVEQETWRIAARGVRVYPTFGDMLAANRDSLDLVAIPTPIPLHAEMHAAVTAIGLPCYLEKPPTLDHAELERMISADRRGGRASLVGFNFIIEPARLALKRRLLAGEFGALRGATLGARWPRPASYFTRNDWAGRLLGADGRIILDSCCGNAMAHFVHNLLFWVGGPDLFSWTTLSALRAELYRAHRIEGADTFFIEADTPCGATLRVALTHACSGASSHEETVVCEHATLRYVVGRNAEIRWNDGRVEQIPLTEFDPLQENYLEYFRYLAGESPRPATTLADCRPFVALNNLAHVSAETITPFPAALLSAVRDEKDQKDYFDVAGLARAQDAFLARGTWPGTEWGRSSGRVVTTGDLGTFHDVIRRLAKTAVA